MTLSINYTPLSRNNLEIGTEFKPQYFSIKPSSHAKSLRLLNENTLSPCKASNLPQLFPSELWGMARLLSARFGRLNEVAIASAKWEIHHAVLPQQELTVSGKITDKREHGGLPFAKVGTETTVANGELLFRADDVVLLLHDVESGFYCERDRRPSFTGRLLYECERRVYFRHDWDPAIWHNNIHTDEYARQFGYERGLPEFIMYMDWTYWSIIQVCPGLARSGLSIHLRRILPVYKGEVVRVTVHEERIGRYTVRFLLGGQERLYARVCQL